MCIRDRVEQQCSLYSKFCNTNINKYADVKTHINSKYDIDSVRIVGKLADKGLNNLSLIHIFINTVLNFVNFDILRRQDPKTDQNLEKL